MESVRTSRGPRQRTVATLGKLPGLDNEARVGWEHIAGILNGKARQRDFLEPAQSDPPQWATVDLGAMRVERLRRFGEVYLGLALWRRRSRSFTSAFLATRTWPRFFRVST